MMDAEEEKFPETLPRSVGSWDLGGVSLDLCQRITVEPSVVDL